MTNEPEKPAKLPGLGHLLNVLHPPPPPPTLEQEVRRLIAVHGADAVKLEVRLATKKPLGRRPEKDWPLLAEDITQDARDWLDGRDPFSIRSSYDIARRYTEKKPGHSAPATMLRIQRKLAKQRKEIMLYRAFQLSETEYPFAAYFRVVAALATLHEGAGQGSKSKAGQKATERSDVWRRTLELDQERLSQYREIHGEPEPTMTWAQIEAAPRYPANALGRLLEIPKGGMFAAPPPKLP